ncbi:MAG TPA: hypothetical protein PLK88_01285 [Methanothrix sp.]|nr:hypothetical protein [Methanothrix sp.]HQJ79007.1 hypothetical protein [Methanothrix sp.]HUM81755.1 hypothetical protein [Methanothrix sp.]
MEKTDPHAVASGRVEPNHPDDEFWKKCSRGSDSNHGPANNGIKLQVCRAGRFDRRSGHHLLADEKTDATRRRAETWSAKIGGLPKKAMKLKEAKK